MVIVLDRLKQPVFAVLYQDCIIIIALEIQKGEYVMEQRKWHLNEKVFYGERY